LLSVVDQQDSVPGLRYVRGWIDGDTQIDLLTEIDAAPWSGELKRRVQHYGYRYDYQRRSVPTDGPARRPAPPIPDWAAALAARLHQEGHLDRPAEQVIVNEYLPGQGISPHIDSVASFGPQVAAVSLASACTMEFLTAEADRRVPVRLEPGSLCVMTGPARETWRHTIPARKSDPVGEERVPRGRRVSVTFRTLCVR
jgi:alkylated DNA repair dioxygenase AlkB